MVPSRFFNLGLRLNRPVGVVVKDIATGAQGLGFDSRVDQVGHSWQSPTARHRCDTSSELCCQTLSRGDEPASPYTLRRETASIMKISFIWFGLR